MWDFWVASAFLMSYDSRTVDKSIPYPAKSYFAASEPVSHLAAVTALDRELHKLASMALKFCHYLCTCTAQ
ncbi:uncharacterized protein MYCFIDRAFT_174670 [Pseudocercospora fijiensis CIRAD86]|uniref:Uncharacterized protein n=1 Tax=Pseudocercospora fijiensis (strain CIRAD86) TaxID=383855 RepID=M2Z002_PSEFD|nr:uncharacterized protein MYCFIDRAFT_174670 [Pseudocercospora fijiensis CIRAD86]EME83190.1 hypothetical protein MYCFIDRAFT_174670 [Pseudocercospora fijiensis CIRAD86]